MLNSFKCQYVDIVDATKSVLFCWYYYDYTRNACVSKEEMWKKIVKWQKVKA